jgi:hypothetical protein
VKGIISIYEPKTEDLKPKEEKENVVFNQKLDKIPHWAL